jgi:hypothetical protein
LDVYTDQNQIPAGSLREAIEQRAFEARSKERKREGGSDTDNYAEERRLGGPYTKSFKNQMVPAEGGGQSMKSGKQTVSPFMAIFKYDCPCEPEAALSWERKDEETGEFKADPPKGGIGRWTVSNKKAKGEDGQDTDDKADLLLGKCWKAVIDTPGNQRFAKSGLTRVGDAADLGDPPGISGIWRVKGKVKWNNGNECSQQWTVTIDKGKIKATRDESKGDGSEKK